MLLSRDDSGSGSKTEQSVALLEQKWHVVSSKMEERKVSPQNTVCDYWAWVVCLTIACNYHLVSVKIFRRPLYSTRSCRTGYRFWFNHFCTNQAIFPDVKFLFCIHIKLHWWYWFLPIFAFVVHSFFCLYQLRHMRLLTAEWWTYNS